MRVEQCKTCKGFGAIGFIRRTICPDCNGEGYKTSKIVMEGQKPPKPKPPEIRIVSE